MRKVIKNIPVFFLCLAWLVITTHLIIPHDHHLTDPLSAKQDACPVSNAKTGHTSHFPMHCHAFNDLTSEKAINYFFTENIQYNDIQIPGFFDPLAFNMHLTGIPVFNIPSPILNSLYLGLTPLRAPPSLS
jgi:hypothetical protein